MIRDVVEDLFEIHMEHHIKKLHFNNNYVCDVIITMTTSMMTSFVVSVTDAAESASSGKHQVKPSLVKNTENLSDDDVISDVTFETDVDQDELQGTYDVITYDVI